MVVPADLLAETAGSELAVTDGLRPGSALLYAVYEDHRTFPVPVTGLAPDRPQKVLHRTAWRPGSSTRTIVRTPLRSAGSRQVAAKLPQTGWTPSNIRLDKQLNLDKKFG